MNEGGCSGILTSLKARRVLDKDQAEHEHGENQCRGAKEPLAHAAAKVGSEFTAGSRFRNIDSEQRVMLRAWRLRCRSR